MISSTSATVPGAGGGATTEGQGEEEEALEGLREVEEVEEVEGEVSVVVSVVAAADDVRSLRRRCLLRERDPAAAGLEKRDRYALSGAAENEAEACRNGAARRELEDVTAAAAVAETTVATRGGVIRRAAAAPLLAAALIPQSQQRPRKAAAGALIASVERWNESAEALLALAKEFSRYLARLCTCLILFFRLIFHLFPALFPPPTWRLESKKFPSLLSLHSLLLYLARCSPPLSAALRRRAALRTEQRRRRRAASLLLLSGDAASRHPPAAKEAAAAVAAAKLLLLLL